VNKTCKENLDPFFIVLYIWDLFSDENLLVSWVELCVLSCSFLWLEGFACYKRGKKTVLFLHYKNGLLVQWLWIYCYCSIVLFTATATYNNKNNLLKSLHVLKNVIWSILKCFKIYPPCFGTSYNEIFNYKLTLLKYILKGSFWKLKI